MRLDPEVSFLSRRHWGQTILTSVHGLPRSVKFGSTILVFFDPVARVLTCNPTALRIGEIDFPWT